jgi:hypothetical protein
MFPYLPGSTVINQLSLPVRLWGGVEDSLHKWPSFSPFSYVRAPHMRLCSSFHEEIRPIFPPLTLGRCCDFYLLTKWGRTDGVPIPCLDLKSSLSFPFVLLEPCYSHKLDKPAGKWSRGKETSQPKAPKPTNPLADLRHGTWWEVLWEVISLR